MPAIMPTDYYGKRIEELTASLSIMYKRRNLLGWLRLIAILFGILLIWVNWGNGGLLIAASLIIIAAIFLFLVNKDLGNNDQISHHENLKQINEDEIRILQHQYTHRPDGANLTDSLHPYAEDLDIFGRASLYQYINRTHSEQGNYLLASWLKNPASPDEIMKRQNGVKELCQNPGWMQEFRARSSSTVITIATEQTIREWLGEKNKFIHRPIWSVVRIVVPVLALTLLGAYISDVINYQQFISGLVVFGFVAFFITREVMPVYQKLNKISSQVDTLSNSISFIEDSSFKEELLSSLQKYLRHENMMASKAIQQLNKILARFDYRFNPLVFIPLNIFLLWDLQQVLQLEKWKEQNNNEVRHWFESLETYEALCSLGTLSFNHPLWCFPGLNKTEPEFSAKGLGHPLIDPTKSVVNDFSTTGKGQINIITGSNMAGKSTFLRAVGVNMILGSMGAPVNASAMMFSPLRVMSSMRIKDNLEESTSTFYAELKKLKTIIDAVKKNEPVFILLDEILRGTNSNDRHTGSKALIRQLLADQAIGLVATHDLELASLSEEYPGVHNYHFDVQVKAEELFFDYKLKPGICTSLNASILMRKIGIEI